MMIQNKQNKMSHIKNVKKTIGNFIDSNKVNNRKNKSVKTMGEVMTPIKLVEEMIDTLPDEVWTNPTLKWLDPCNGIGTFFSVIVERLMKGLISFQPDDNLRYKHVVENMIYACELQEKNIASYLYAFDPCNEYTLNTYCGSYLDEGFDKHIMEFWGVEKFDVIVMNPPYQKLKEGNKISQALWDKFVIKTVSQLVEGGYLVAVHPSGWRNVNGRFKKIQTLLKNKQITYLEIHNVSDGIKTFNVATRYDFYCLHNVPNTMFTKIKCMDGTIERVDISKMEFIPNGRFKEFEKLIAKDSEERVDVLHSFSAYETRKNYMNKEQTEDFKYPCVQNVNVKNVFSCIWYSNTNNNGHFGIPKVIFGRRTSGVYIDKTGEYGMAEDCKAIVDEQKNLPFIQKAMLNFKFIEFLKQCDFGGTCDRYNSKIIALFRKDFWKDFQD